MTIPTSKQVMEIYERHSQRVKIEKDHKLTEQVIIWFHVLTKQDFKTGKKDRYKVTNIQYNKINYIIKRNSVTQMLTDTKLRLHDIKLETFNEDSEIWILNQKKCKLHKYGFSDHY